jgi:hypothetical protein
MLDAHTTSQDPEAIAAYDDEILDSYYELLADLGSSAYFGGASADDAMQIARGQMSDEFLDRVAAAQARAAAATQARAAAAPAVDIDPDDLPF